MGRVSGTTFGTFHRYTPSDGKIRTRVQGETDGGRCMESITWHSQHCQDTIFATWGLSMLDAQQLETAASVAKPPCGGSSSSPRRGTSQMEPATSVAGYVALISPILQPGAPKLQLSFRPAMGMMLLANLWPSGPWHISRLSRQGAKGKSKIWRLGAFARADLFVSQPMEGRMRARHSGFTNSIQWGLRGWAGDCRARPVSSLPFPCPIPPPVAAFAPAGYTEIPEISLDW